MKPDKDELKLKAEKEEVKESGETKKKKKEADEGSRWAAMVLLIVTIILGAGFYFFGQFSWEDFKPEIGGQQTFTFD